MFQKRQIRIRNMPQKRCKQVRHILIQSASTLNPPGTRAEGTATVTSSLEAMSWDFALLLKSSHKAWSRLEVVSVPDGGLEACAGTSTSTDRGVVVLGSGDGLSTQGAIQCSSRLVTVSAASRVAEERCIEFLFHCKWKSHSEKMNDLKETAYHQASSFPVP